MALNVRYNPLRQPGVKPTLPAQATPLGAPLPTLKPKTMPPSIPPNDAMNTSPQQGMGGAVTNRPGGIRYNPTLPPQPQGMGTAPPAPLPLAPQPVMPPMAPAPQMPPPPQGGMPMMAPQRQVMPPPPPNIYPPPPPVPPPDQGALPPPTGPRPLPPPNIGVDRTGETLQERLDRLQNKERTGYGTDRTGERIGDLQARLAAGEKYPDQYKGLREGVGDRLKTPHPLGQMPKNNSQFRTGDLAELAPPRGTTTYFRDQGNSNALDQRKKRIQKQIDREKAAGKKTPENKPPPGVGFLKAKPTKKPVKPPTDEEKKKKEQRMKDKKKKRPQPGTPQRPYINRQVTYKPLGFGGKLRV